MRIYCCARDSSSGDVMRARLAMAGLSDVRIVITDREDEAGQLVAAARTFADDRDDKSPVADALLVASGLVVHKDLGSKLSAAMTNCETDSMALCHVMNDWGGVRYVGSQASMQNLVAVPAGKLMFIGAVWVTRVRAERLAAEWRDRERDVDDARLIGSLTAGSDYLVCTYPALLIADPSASHKHAFAFSGWDLDNFHRASQDTKSNNVKPTSPNCCENTSDCAKRQDAATSPNCCDNKFDCDSGRAKSTDGERKDGGGLIRVLWAESPSDAALTRWRAMGGNAWLMLESSREGALTEAEMQRTIILDARECRKMNPLHLGARETPETAIALLHRALSETASAASHISIEPLGASAPDWSRSDPSDLVAHGLESYEQTAQPDWPGWRARLRATKSRPPSTLPSVKERWRCAPPHAAPLRLSARFLAAVADQIGGWSSNADIFLPTLCSLQYGFTATTV